MLNHDTNLNYHILIITNRLDVVPMGESHSKLRKPNIRQISEQTGLSMMTVSRALRGLGSVRPETRKKVLSAAAALGYNGSRGVVVPRRGSTDHRLEVLLPLFGNATAILKSELHKRFYDGLNQRLRENGGGVTVVECMGLADLLEAVKEHRPRGVVTRQSLRRDWLRTVEIFCPVISCAADDFLLGIDCVYMNENRAAMMALTKLWEKGHRQIAWFGIRDVDAQSSIAAHIWMETENPVLRDISGVHDVRYAAWSYIANRFAENPMKLLFLERNHRRQSISEVVKKGADQLFAEVQDLTAIIMPTDVTAYQMVNELQSRGLRVPEDISVVSYGGTSETKLCSPELSTIRMPFDEVGRTVPELLERRLAHPEARTISVALEPTFMEGGTIARPPVHQRGGNDDQLSAEAPASFNEVSV